LRNAREKAALKEASDWKGKMLITGLCIGVIALISVAKYGLDFYRERQNTRDVSAKLKKILNPNQ
jgi:hypothetical protein